MDKKAQHETLGFILIIIMVMVAGLILLGLSLTKPAKIGQSSKVSHFLESSMHHTSSCQGASSLTDFEDVQELIKSCYKNQICVNNGNNSCFVLNNTLKTLLATLQTDESAAMKGYELSIYYSPDNESIESLLYLTERFENCSSKYGASKKIYVSTGVNSLIINTNLNICQGSGE
jgi:hypothetical protein